jgi:hypothetical protein
MHEKKRHKISSERTQQKGNPAIAKKINFTAPKEKELRPSGFFVLARVIAAWSLWRESAERKFAWGPRIKSRRSHKGDRQLFWINILRVLIWGA